jgi:hypothetical protein
MLICNVSLRPPRAGIMADIAEAIDATDATAIGQIVFATLVDDPASVGDTVDAYLGEIMVEAASAADTWSGSIPAVFTVDVLEAASADATTAVLTAVDPPTILTGLVGWWDASVFASFNLTGSLINSVADQSGNSQTMNWDGFNKPTYSATGLNSLPAIVFGPSTTVAAGLGTAAGFPMGTGNTLTTFAVAFMTSPASHFGNTHARLIAYAKPSSNDYDNAGSWTFNRSFNDGNMIVGRNSLGTATVAFTYTTPHRFITTINSSGAITIYIDGVATSGTTIGGNWVSGGSCTIAIQAPFGTKTAFWEGAVAEAGVATGYSDATAVAALDTYLKNKWGL